MGSLNELLKSWTELEGECYNPRLPSYRDTVLKATIDPKLTHDMVHGVKTKRK